MRTVLIADSDTRVRKAVATCLRDEGLEPIGVSSGEAALAMAKANRFELIIVDWLLPEVDGVALCRAIRRDSSNAGTPLLILSGRHDESAAVLALDSGADDFVTKPLGIRELAARVRALLRRACPARQSAGEIAPALTHGVLRIDSARRTVAVAGRDVHLTRQEFDLLFLLVSHPGIVFSRQTLLCRIWPENTFVEERTVDALVKRLRRKIEPGRGPGQIVLSVRGAGYKSAELPPAGGPTAFAPTSVDSVRGAVHMGWYPA